MLDSSLLLLWLLPSFSVWPYVGCSLQNTRFPSTHCFSHSKKNPINNLSSDTLKQASSSPLQPETYKMQRASRSALFPQHDIPLFPLITPLLCFQRKYEISILCEWGTTSIKICPRSCSVSRTRPQSYGSLFKPHPLAVRLLFLRPLFGGSPVIPCCLTGLEAGSKPGLGLMNVTWFSSRG